MEAALDSPLEALAFNYLSYGLLTAVNNIWAWLAVVTAAVSFWRIRVLSTPIAAVAVPEMVEEIIAAEEAAAAPARSAPCVVAEGQGITKMKFCLYYAEEEDFGGDDGGDSEECGGGEAAGLGFGGDWEGVIAMRMGDMGWYRWQDRTVLSGNVVRLWEGRRRRRHAAAEAVDGGFVW